MECYYSDVVRVTDNRFGSTVTIFSFKGSRGIDENYVNIPWG